MSWTASSILLSCATFNTSGSLLSHSFFPLLLYHSCMGCLEYIYTTIGGLSSKCEECLAVRSQFDSDHGVDFLRLHVANSRPLCDRFLRFIVRCFLLKKNNAALHLMNAVFMLDVATALYGRLIARWRHSRWCYHCGKGPCFYSTRGPTGSLLVGNITKNSRWSCES